MSDPAVNSISGSPEVSNDGISPLSPLPTVAIQPASPQGTFPSGVPSQYHRPPNNLAAYNNNNNDDDSDDHDESPTPMQRTSTSPLVPTTTAPPGVAVHHQRQSSGSGSAPFGASSDRPPLAPSPKITPKTTPLLRPATIPTPSCGGSANKAPNDGGRSPPMTYTTTHVNSRPSPAGKSPQMGYPTSPGGIGASAVSPASSHHHHHRGGSAERGAGTSPTSSNPPSSGVTTPVVQVPLIEPRFPRRARGNKEIEMTNSGAALSEGSTSDTVNWRGKERITVRVGKREFEEPIEYHSYALYRDGKHKLHSEAVGYSSDGDLVLYRDEVLRSDQRALLPGARHAYVSGSESDSRTPHVVRRGSSLGAHTGAPGWESDGGGGNLSGGSNSQQRTPGGGMRPVDVRVSGAVCLNPAARPPQGRVRDGFLPEQEAAASPGAALSAASAPPPGIGRSHTAFVGTAEQVSKYYKKRKYPGVKCPKNRKVRNRLMNDHLATALGRKIYATANRFQDQEEGITSDSDDNNNNDNDNRKKRLDADAANRKQAALPTFALPRAVENRLVHVDEQRQQQYLGSLGMQLDLTGGSAKVVSSGPAQVVDRNAGAWRLQQLPQKLRGELAHAMKTDFMPKFVRELDLRFTAFILEHRSSNRGGNVADGDEGKKTSPTQLREPTTFAHSDTTKAVVGDEGDYIEIICQDGYGRLITHAVAAYYRLQSESRDAASGAGPRVVRVTMPSAVAAAAAAAADQQQQQEGRAAAATTASASPPKRRGEGVGAATFQEAATLMDITADGVLQLPSVPLSRLLQSAVAAPGARGGGGGGGTGGSRPNDDDGEGANKEEGSPFLSEYKTKTQKRKEKREAREQELAMQQKRNAKADDDDANGGANRHQKKRGGHHQGGGRRGLQRRDSSASSAHSSGNERRRGQLQQRPRRGQNDLLTADYVVNSTRPHPSPPPDEMDDAAIADEGLGHYRPPATTSAKSAATGNPYARLGGGSGEGGSDPHQRHPGRHHHKKGETRRDEDNDDNNDDDDNSRRKGGGGGGGQRALKKKQQLESSGSQLGTPVSADAPSALHSSGGGGHNKQRLGGGSKPSGISLAEAARNNGKASNLLGADQVATQQSQSEGTVASSSPVSSWGGGDEWLNVEADEDADAEGAAAGKKTKKRFKPKVRKMR